jgi:hypothetical protein
MSVNLETWSGIQDIAWVPVLNNPIYLGSHYKIVPTEGYMAWEYNPLRNYRLSENMYEKDGKYYTKYEIGITDDDELEYLQNCELLSILESKIPLDMGKIEPLRKSIEDYEKQFSEYTLHEAGELVDFITNELSFNLSHPVDILPQYSYDGSVNLILNDGLNIPRLINSRFTVTGRNTYKVIDRKGDNDTNIYDQGEQFDVDTSLFKNVNKIPKLEYLGTSTGNMSIGNYHFYFKYADADGNESDWVAESGLVSIFIGNTPNSVNTGIRDENSIKSVRFRLSNIDIGYSYVKVYYTRYSADVDSNFVVSAKRIDKNFLVSNSGICSILITGDENETEVTLEEINSSFDVIQNAKTQCSAANRLFMANVHKARVEYDMLTKLSLCFCPYKSEEDYPLVNDGMDVNYNISANVDGYYDSEFIYNKTGYWPGELYRFGVVYILKDGSLSPVFNIRGGTNIPTQQYDVNTGNPIRHYSIESALDSATEEDFVNVLNKIEFSEEDYMLVGGSANNENAKGVVQFSSDFYNTDQAFPIVGLTITANKQVVKELKKYVKGFFFVRQKRIPLTLAQGIVVGLDKESRTPTLPTLAGIIDTINHNNSFVETSDINDINYVSEGFLSRYLFTLDKKSSGVFKKIATAIGVVAVLAAAVVATVFTCGAAAVALGVAIAPAFIAGTTAFASLVTAVGITAGVSIAVSAAAFGAQAVALKARQNRHRRAAQAVKGRNDDIPKDYQRKEQSESRKIKHDLEERYIIKDSSKNVPDALIVPDYQVNQPYYNQFLTGDNFTVSLTYEQPIYNYLNDGYFESDERHFYVSEYVTQNDNRSYAVNLVGVPDGCPIKMIGEEKYCARAGYPEEAHQYEFQGTSYEDTENKKANSDIIRGNFGSFVGMKGYRGHACDQVNIMIPGYRENNLFEYVQLRAQDTSAFYAISDRIDINEINKETSFLRESEHINKDFSETYYRGDCYICQYTHRIIRNFNDPSAPYNDKIIDPNSWRDNYDPDNPESYASINLGDVNAVKLGLWLTFQLRSSYNLNIRTIDKSHVDEALMCGNHRSFYPHYGQLANGNQKIPDSAQYNKGFTKSVSEKYYFEVPDVPYIKQEFQNRIVFSDIHINDAYKNGFRVLRTMNHKDYPMTHGSITKLIELKNTLLVVFEHGIGLISINNSAEHPSQILSDVNIISDKYGSQWKDSIIKTPSGVYGVDTVAKKIWRVKEGQIELISDMRVQEFLNQNITLSERELTPILGVRNVKTVYNAFKHDIMFTFYDNLHGVHEKSWNLCWNELLGIFTTFYSWIPSDMENIDNIPFSFNRDTVKAIGKLGVSDHNNDYSDGVTLSNNVLTVIELPPKPGESPEEQTYQPPTFSVADKSLVMYYTNKKGEQTAYNFDNVVENREPGVVTLSEVVNRKDFVGFLHLDNRSLPDGNARYHIDYELLRDSQGNYKMFEIKQEKIAVEPVTDMLTSNTDYRPDYVLVSYLALKDGVYTPDLLSELYYRNIAGNSFADVDINKRAPKAIRHTVSNKKIEGTQILNKLVLDKLVAKYGEDWVVGNDTSYNSPTANPCGTLKEIYERCTFAEMPEGADETWEDKTTKYHGILLFQHWLLESEESYQIYTDKPIFKNKAGKRLMLPKELQVNPNKIVRYLNIKAKVFIEPIQQEMSAQEAYYNQFANGDHDVCMIDAGYFESSVAITTSFNLSLLSTDFWKHGQAGLIDVSDKIYPTYWYGQQHPFEFECVVVDNPSVHKIFTNLELVANKAKPESFHYEVVGDTYDFAEDKPTMYFRQEALKALYQYNGYDIEYNPNFLEIEPKQHNRSAELPKYYSRWDTINEVYDSYKRFDVDKPFNYDHLAGAEIIYYPTRNEFRVWNHVEAIDADSLSQDLATSVIKANCRYLEDKWLVSINPIIVTYKNEIDKTKVEPGTSMFSKDAFGIYKYSTWVSNYEKTSKLPPINIQGTKMEETLGTQIQIPNIKTGEGKDNALYGLYDLTEWDKGSWRPIDPTKNKERRETDVRGKFMKVRIRYSGEELAIIDFLNTIYQISFA